MMRARVRTLALTAATVGLSMLLSGCLGVPTDGDVVSVGTGATSPGSTGIAIDPRPPRKGMNAAEIVDGFLEAMLATPLQTTTAQQFLTPEAQETWEPDREILVYSGKAAAVADDGGVTVQLGPTWRIDGRGVWQGAVSTANRRITFRTSGEGEQWRISQAPNALIVPDWWFEGRYSQLSLYYFNSTETQLVPEPIFVPKGQEAATVLVRNLLLGPSAGLGPLVHSVIPGNVSQGLSVPVDANGVATIALTGMTSDQRLTPDQTNKVIAQLGWTLRQDSAIARMRISFDGEPITVSNGATEFDVDKAGPQFDPAGYQTSPLLYGLRDGKVVAGTLPQLASTRGPLGAAVHKLRSIAVNLRGARIAAVTASGRAVMVTSTSDPEAPVVTPVTDARDLLKPSWDGLGRLWLLDRRRTGAVVTVVDGDQSRRAEIPGVSGADVRRLLVSRDGTRVLAVVRSDLGDRVVAVRVSVTDQRISAVGGARVVSSDLGQIDDLVWSDPTQITVMHRSDGSARVTTVPIDGAGVALMPGGTLVGRDLSAMIGSPGTGQPTYGIDGRHLISLSTVGRDQTIASGVTALTYVG